ncbi:universal stress protein [Paractinoplanes ferrugineus]|uniref:Universal stress protein UspA n=1 Tax=Paractinoplanes ferrugineus TaxID=113564 RepID=A0A919J8K2_9ACTN|nr:universal stress protein [Actinoplanes ferrugineus]GIE14649.1 universal stress protein UspA [Actinoplanes ferrugineus]
MTAKTAMTAKTIKTTKKIIVGYDRSADAKAAAVWALGQAARTGALVEFFFAYEWPSWAPASRTIGAAPVWPGGETDRAVNGMLDEAVANARQTHPGVRTKISIERAGAAGTLIERSAEASLIVLGSRGHDDMTGVFGSVSIAVSAQARCPVVVVRGEAPAGAPVVVGVDGSAPARSALHFATELAAARSVPLRVHEAVDRPTTELAVAGETAQMLVVGTRGRGALRGMLLGSVSQHLLRHSSCTVAVVPASS